ncbi:MAG: hypothetical protein ACX931_05075 [Saccharospirillum sp.]
MAIVTGGLLGLAVAGLATGFKFDRDRSFYPTVLSFIATYYVLFAVIDGSGEVVLLEVMVAFAFVLAAIVGFKLSLWVIAIALFGHGVFDILHYWAIDNAGVPIWWYGFCAGFDVVMGAWLTGLLIWRHSDVQKKR